MRWLGTLCCLSLVLVVSDVRGQEGPGQRAGEKVDQAIDRLREGTKEVVGQVERSFDEARKDIDRLSIQGRVYARLHWDKSLENASISIDVGKDGAVTLHGTVSTEVAKVKAEELATDTVGVQRVVNDLKVPPVPLLK